MKKRNWYIAGVILVIVLLIGSVVFYFCQKNEAVERAEKYEKNNETVSEEISTEEGELPISSFEEPKKEQGLGMSDETEKSTEVKTKKTVETKKGTADKKKGTTSFAASAIWKDSSTEHKGTTEKVNGTSIPNTEGTSTKPSAGTDAPSTKPSTGTDTPSTNDPSTEEPEKPSTGTDTPSTDDPTTGNASDKTGELPFVPAF